ncbi:ferredoxin--NADP reductase [Chryseobacterium sp. Leaf394]|uniref:ferredoxin--NADP reductase n=1 Tax=Chryseobacterium sp. Leaf394 TaxID=1736361 RepID=UPI0006F28BDA|nr:ferredoxin--NADP reductase [Chryseobacterium sp. Leaf394]KQS93210.1 hypothetical protein ASG21_12545 [Chryseobacterium sp. Leaf394]
MTHTYTLKVIEIKRETEDTVTLCFKQPALRKIKYIAGQYITLIVRINGRRFLRPYSFSSCFGIDQHIEITVKRVPHGIVSNHIVDVVKVGDSIEVLPPMGDFVLGEKPAQNNIFLWGIGSGITPLISIAKFVLYNNDSQNIHLTYGNRNFESTIFLDAIENLKKQFPNRFHVKYFHTKFEVNKNFPNVIEGRIDQRKVASIMNGGISAQDQLHFICGPFGLKESVKKALKSLDINEDYIFSEDFEIVKDPKDFENIYTQTVNLDFEGKITQIEVVKGQSILEACLNANLELPYSCQTGNCSTCKGVLQSGEIKMIGLTKERTDLSESEFLLCCSHPLDNEVLIKI